jgi:hypothetical protein
MKVNICKKEEKDVQVTWEEDYPQFDAPVCIGSPGGRLWTVARRAAHSDVSTPYQSSSIYRRGSTFGEANQVRRGRADDRISGGLW